jgi:hypothetical protein
VKLQSRLHENSGTDFVGIGLRLGLGNMCSIDFAGVGVLCTSWTAADKCFSYALEAIV